MSGMSPERLADIRERHSAGLGLERPGDVAALLAEVKRLREGIEALHLPVDIEPSETICGHCSWRLPNGRYFGQIVDWPCPTADLLNPEP